MEALWSGGERSVRAVMGALNDGLLEPRAYTTYMTVLSRLHNKGLLERRRDGKADLYRPALGRDEYRERRAAADVDALVDRHGDAVFAHFARRIAGLDSERLKELERLAQRHD